MTILNDPATVSEEHDRWHFMHAKSRTVFRSTLPAVLLILILALSGCQTQKDAVAAAQQMCVTVATLRAYYRSLASIVDKTAEAQSAQSYINGVPFDDDTRRDLEQTRSELKKRADMADALQRLAALFTDISSSGAAADAAKAADALNTELISMKAFKSNSAETEALKVAANAIVNSIKAHDEVKAARLISPLAATLSSFFDAEADLYQSVADSYYVIAASNSGALIDRNQVATGFLYRSSLQPFGLVPEVTDQALKKVSTSGLKARVNDRLTEHRRRDAAVTTELSASLHVMRDRLAKVAARKPLQATLPPLTLDGVRAWMEEVRTDVGEN